MNTAAELAALRAALGDLAAWAYVALDREDTDRQYVAEHLRDAIEALANGDEIPTAPF
ncbi:hypothetical protein [Luedemannella helvata]|uniref:Uncharacterized protein n=1 Tax=Luedemannella helvata TaxID=349315 RepID=A0ABN2L7V7_9ACTN